MWIMQQTASLRYQSNKSKKMLLLFQFAAITSGTHETFHVQLEGHSDIGKSKLSRPTLQGNTSEAS